jgi:hypothetical protein
MKARKPKVFGLLGGGAYWTRTSDPIDVNDVLYQLSQSTILNEKYDTTLRRKSQDGTLLLHQGSNRRLRCAKARSAKAKLRKRRVFGALLPSSKG